MRARHHKTFFLAIVMALTLSGFARAETWFADSPKILVYMDKEQNDHLRAYGVAYWCLQPPRGYKVQWLLNYRGGSFLLDDSQDVRDRATLMGVSFKVIPPAEANRVYREISETNADVSLLEKTPRVAVYVPQTELPWDDAVRLALDYAKIPYDTIYDPEVLSGKTAKYDWIHLHHEDFTGQFGKFYASYRNADWYVRQVRSDETLARELGFPSVHAEKHAVALALKEFVGRGGFLFAMCSAPDSLDVALAAGGLDIVPSEIDGTPISPDAQRRLDFSQSFAFRNFTVVRDANVYEISDIDVTPPNINQPWLVPDFTLFEFSAKQDPVLSILVQDHTAGVHEFLGQTTAFKRSLIKDDVVVLGDTEGGDRVKYVHGNFGSGSFTFLGGHDPEDFAHMVGDPPTDLAIHKNSPGYRLILNNVLFPAVRKKEKKT